MVVSVVQFASQFGQSIHNPDRHCGAYVQQNDDRLYSSERLLRSILRSSPWAWITHHKQDDVAPPIEYCSIAKSNDLDMRQPTNMFFSPMQDG